MTVWSFFPRLHRGHYRLNAVLGFQGQQLVTWALAPPMLWLGGFIVSAERCRPYLLRLLKCC